MNSFLLQLLLAAAPVAPPAPTASMTEILTPLYALLGSLVLLQLVSAAFGLVKWLGARTVATEDKDKAETRAQLKEHEARFEEIESSVSMVDRAISTVQLEMKQVLSTVESTRGMVVEIKGSMDNRFEKQSDFYRGQIKELLVGVDKRLEDLEYKLRQDMTRAIHDASVMNAKVRKAS